MELTGHWLILPDFQSYVVKAEAEGGGNRQLIIAIASFFQTFSGRLWSLGTEQMYDIHQTPIPRGKSEGRRRGEIDN